MISRLSEFIKYKGVSVRAFEQSISASDGMIRRAINNNTDIQSKWITAIADNYPDLSLDWLILGRGSMLIDNGSKKDIEFIHHPKYTEKNIEVQSIKLYDVSAAANLKTLFDNKEQNILGEIMIPNIPRCDGAVYVNGDSMYPLLKSGDIIAYKEIHSFTCVVYGEMYLISFNMDGDEYLTVKYVNHSEEEDCIKLVSYNPHHHPMDIPVTCINAMGLIKFSIRKNTMI